jgi:hypothetical protein
MSDNTCARVTKREADLHTWARALYALYFSTAVTLDVIVHKQLLASLEADTRHRELRPINHGRAAYPRWNLF